MFTVAGTRSSWWRNPASETGLSPRFLCLELLSNMTYIALCWRDWCSQPLYFLNAKKAIAKREPSFWPPLFFEALPQIKFLKKIVTLAFEKTQNILHWKAKKRWISPNKRFKNSHPHKLTNIMSPPPLLSPQNNDRSLTVGSFHSQRSVCWFLNLKCKIVTSILKYHGFLWPDFSSLSLNLVAETEENDSGYVIMVWPAVRITS